MKLLAARVALALTALIPMAGAYLYPAQPVTSSTAVSEIQAGHFAQADSIIRQLIQQHPSDPELWNLLGIVSTELNRGSEAEHAFQHGLKLAPASVSLNENAGLFYFRQARYPQARDLLDQAIRLGSNKAQVRFSLASARLRSGESAAALDELRALESELPNTPEYWEERGRAELPGKPAAAAQSFEHALSLTPRSLVALNGAAYAAERQHLDEKALAYLIEAKTAAPDDIPTLMHFAAVCIRRDLGPDAVEALERVRRLAPSDQDAIYLLGRANISIQKWQRAHDLFSKFASAQPRFAPTYYALGWLDLKLGHVQEARLELSRALALNPRLNDARYELGQLELNDGEIESAAREFQRILQVEPQHALANTALGEIRMREGRLDEAERLLETAVQSSPDLAPAHYKLSTVLARLHQPAQAEKERQLAADLAAAEKRSSKTQLRLILPGDGADSPAAFTANLPAR